MEDGPLRHEEPTLEDVDHLEDRLYEAELLAALGVIVSLAASPG